MNGQTKKEGLGFRPSTKRKIKKFCFVSILILITIGLYDVFSNEINNRSQKLVTDTWHKTSEIVKQAKQTINIKMPTFAQKETQTTETTETTTDNNTNAVTISQSTPFFDRASTFAKPLGFLPKGTKLMVNEVHNNWVKIKGDGMWVRRSDLNIKEAL